MESAMLYRDELLLGMYAVTAGIYHAFPHMNVSVVPLIVSIGAWLWSDVNNVFVVVILSLAANSIHWLVSLGLSRILARRSTKPKEATAFTVKRHAGLVVILFALIQLTVVLVSYLRGHSILCLSVWSAVFATAVLFLPVTAFISTTAEPITVTFLSLFLPVWSFLVVGKLFMIAWNAVSAFSSVTPDLTRFLCVICLPVYLRLVLYSQKMQILPSHQLIMSTLYLLAIVVFAPRMLKVGGGYVVGQFLSCIACVDVLVAILERYKVNL